MLILIVAECNVNRKKGVKMAKKEKILIVAECNVNELNVNEEKDIKFILIVAECNVNLILTLLYLIIF